MRVLVACEFSGTVRRAFRGEGHDAWSCDILPAEDGSEHHYQDDVRDVIRCTQWDLMVGHPPCTRLANSGVRWLHERDLWPELDEAVDFFRDLWAAPIYRICLENPVMHRYARDQLEGLPAPQYIQPWEYGHGETKKTGLWLKNLPPLQPTDIVEGREARVHRMPPGPERAKERSRFFSGVAKAMAQQWGIL
jgi:hypothetical protein